MRNERLRGRTLPVMAAICLTMVLNGCAGRNKEEKPASPTLPPAIISMQAPDGDSAVRRAGNYTIYIPEGNRLTPRSVFLEGSSLETTAEMLVLALLDQINANQDGNRNRALALYQEQAPEISGGICTVNLDLSALKLSYSEYYQLSIALATTLCELDEISGTNVLCADKSVALDTSGYLAMGTLTGHPEEPLSNLWDQMDAKKVPLGNDVSRTQMNATATIYYPLAEGRGIGCESRMMTFPGQTPDQLAETLISAIDDTVRHRNGIDGLPGIEAYLRSMPVVTQRDDGGRLVTVSFSENIQELAERWNTDFPCLAAAVTYTMTTFIPGVTEVWMRVGDKPVTEELNNSRHTTGTILGGLIHRSDVSAFLTGSAVVFFEKDGRLTACEKPAERETADSPRAILEALLEGPDRKDRENGIHATLPDAIREDDILGIAADGDALLVNLSAVFRSEIRSAGAEREAILCYSMVNTLCLNTGMKRVYFFFEGEQVETIAGELCWGGEFMYNPGL